MKRVSLRGTKAKSQSKKRKSKEKGAKRDENDGEYEAHDEERDTTEWVAEEEHGVLITFVSLPGGGNILKKIRFSEELFDKWEAQQWWSDNYERIMALYNVQEANAPLSPSQDQDEMLASSTSRSQGDTTKSHEVNNVVRLSTPNFRDEGEELNTTSLQDEVNVQGIEVIEYHPGVFLTFRSLPYEGKELVRVELSTDQFGGKVKAKVWWKENGEKLLQQFSIYSRSS